MSDKVKASRRAFDREFKLQVVKEYHESGKNIATEKGWPKGKEMVV